MATKTASPTLITSFPSYSWSEIFPAVTTPWVQPARCSTIGDLTSHPVYYSDTVAGTMVTEYASVIISWPPNKDYKTCQPPEWQAHPSSYYYNLFFSPAVCPSGWSAPSTLVYPSPVYPFSDGSEKIIMTSARCCPPWVDSKPERKNRYLTDDSGFAEAPYFTFGHTDFRVQVPCTSSFSIEPGQELTATVTEGPQSGQITLLRSGFLVNPIWQIQWQESDLPSMTPRPPLFTQTLEIDTWTESKTTTPAPSPTRKPTAFSTSSRNPTTTITLSASAATYTSSYAPGVREEGRGIEYPLKLFLVIGIPLIGVVACIALCLALWKRARTKRRQRKMFQSQEDSKIEQPPVSQTDYFIDNIEEAPPAYEAKPPAPSYDKGKHVPEEK